MSSQYLPQNPYRRKKQMTRWKRRMRKRVQCFVKYSVLVAVFIGLMCFAGVMMRDKMLHQAINDKTVADSMTASDGSISENSDVMSGNYGMAGIALETEKEDATEESRNDSPLINGELYPEELLELLQKNPETREFVENYPEKYGTVSWEPLTELAGSEQFPLLLQWDERWGYYPYGEGVMGLTGCGPTCLSMVAIYLMGDTSMTPPVIAAFSADNGYCVPGHGTSWELMAEGAQQLGLYADELPLNEKTIADHLKAGNPIICIMGPGDFTDGGHYIVFTEWEDGMVTVMDPNSKTNSAKQWVFEDIKDQIRNLWAYRA